MGTSNVAFVVVAAAALSVPVAASSTPLDEKRCIFEAASQLPRIQDLRISASAAKPADKTVAVADTVARLAAPLQAQELASRFGILDSAILNDLKLGLRNAYSKQIALALDKVTSTAATVEIDLQAAAQKATFAFTCLIGNNGAINASFSGVVR